MKGFKKTLAVILAAAMTLGGTMTVLADDPITSVVGNGDLEGYIDQSIVNVTLPTQAPSFKFMIDPQNLIKATIASSGTFADGTGYTGITQTSQISGNGLYFLNTVSGGTNTLTGTSDALTMTNDGFCDVAVTATATVENLGSVTLKESSTFVANDGTAIYLALTDKNSENENGTAAVGASSKKATISGTLSKVPFVTEGANKTVTINKIAANKYTATIDSGVEKPTYSLYLTGAANTLAPSWVSAKTSTPKVTVTWTTANANGPTVTTSTVTYSKGADTEVGVSLVGATGIKSVTYKNSQGEDATLATSAYSVSDGKLKLSHSVLDTWYDYGVTGRVMTVTFNDDNETTGTFTLNKASE